MSYYEIRNALIGESVEELSDALKKEDYVDIRNFIGQTLLHEFLNRKVKLSVNDLRIVLLFLRVGSNVDLTDNFGDTPRACLLKLGYSVDRIYLTIKTDAIRRLENTIVPQAEEEDLYS
jgi:hypothetical protein